MAVERKIKEEKEKSQYLDAGGGVQGEKVVPNFVTLMLINKFADYNPIIIQCQNLNLKMRNITSPQPILILLKLKKKRTVHMKKYF